MNQEDKERYLRQIALSEVGEEGQERLKRASVLIVGVGGLGSPIATLLTSAGVGRIGIIDYDTVSLSNLPRQTIYTSDDLRLPKVECAARRLRSMNPNATIEVYNARLDDSLAEELFPRYDIIVDGCDNMSTRYIIDRGACRYSKPYVYGAIREFEGQVSIFHHGGAGGYSDLYPENNAPEVTVPPAVMATTPALIGAIEANEVMKIIIGYGETLSRKLLTFDSRTYMLNIFEL